MSAAIQLPDQSPGQFPEETPATPLPSLRFNFSWTLAGNLVYSGCQWGMISVLAKLGSAALVGRFALGLAITAPVFMFTNLQLRNVQATDARSEFAFSDYFTLRVAASLAGLAFIFLIAATMRCPSATALVIVLVGVAKTIETLGDMVAGLLQKAERLDRAAISLILRGAFSLPAFAADFWLRRNLAEAVAATIAVWILVFLLYDLGQARAILVNSGMGRRGRFFAFRPARLKQLALVSAPLGIVMTLISLNVNIPRYLLEHALGEAELGIFASLAYLLVAVQLIINALGQSAVTRMSRAFAEGNLSRFRGVLVKQIAFAASILILGLPLAKLSGRPLLTLIYRPEYARHMTLFLILVAAGGVYAIASFLGYGMTAARCFRMQVPVMAAMTAASALFSLLLIPRFGGEGAAAALLAGALVQVAGSAIVLRRSMLARRLEI